MDVNVAPPIWGVTDQIGVPRRINPSCPQVAPVLFADDIDGTAGEQIVFDRTQQRVFVDQFPPRDVDEYLPRNASMHGRSINGGAPAS